MKKLVLLPMVVLTLFISSCDDDKVDIPNFDAKGDAYILSIIKGQDTLFAPVFKAYANNKIFKAKVSLQEEGAKTLILNSLNNSDTDYILLPEDTDFSKVKNSDITYDFEIVSTTNDTIRSSDSIGKDVIYPVKLNDFKYTEDSHSIEMSWGQQAFADRYYVSILEEKNGKPLFLSGYIKETVYSFSRTSRGWSYGAKLEEGKEYIICINAYKFEDSSSPSILDIEMKSATYKTITW